MVAEAKIEQALFKGVKTMGGLCFKFAPVTAGVPDRVVILPGGKVFFVELKAQGGGFREIQLVMHEKFLRRGVEVVVLSSIKQVSTWLKEVA